MESKKEQVGFLKNKKAQGMSVTTIILIVLGLVVLVVLILGFTIGWDKIAPWIDGGNNVDDIKQQCAISCNLDNEYDFCTMNRELEAPDLPGDVDSVENNCNFFATDSNYVKYSIDKCTGLCTVRKCSLPAGGAITACGSLGVTATLDLQTLCTQRGGCVYDNTGATPVCKDDTINTPNACTTFTDEEKCNAYACEWK